MVVNHASPPVQQQHAWPPTSCNSTRLVYVDMGVNWANTLRLYKDLGVCSDAPNWEIYGFEAMPLIQNYANQFVEYLNGRIPMPIKTVPPTGSSRDLFRFARQYNCTEREMTTSYMSVAFKQCIWNRVTQNLMSIQPNPRLASPLLLRQRLQAARMHNRDPDSPRYTFIPAAVGAPSNSTSRAVVLSDSVPMGTNRIGLIRGGGAMSYDKDAAEKVQPVKVPTAWTDSGEAWKPIFFKVPLVDGAQWLVDHFVLADWVVLKMDIEGPEHGIFRKDRLLDPTRASSCTTRAPSSQDDGCCSEAAVR